jgi:hypothetical protein
VSATRRIEIALRPDQLHDLATMIAPMVAEELRSSELGTTRRLLDAGELAAELGVSREFVYRHSAELGAHKLGDGKRAHLRFDPERAKAAMRTQPNRKRPGRRRRPASPAKTVDPNAVLAVRRQRAKA